MGTAEDNQAEDSFVQYLHYQGISGCRKGSVGHCASACHSAKSEGIVDVMLVYPEDQWAAARDHLWGMEGYLG
jgi:hypothetical protein